MKKSVKIIVSIVTLFLTVGCGAKNNSEKSTEELQNRKPVWETETFEIQSDVERVYTLTEKDVYTDGKVDYDKINRAVSGSTYYIMPDELADKLTNEELVDLSLQYGRIRGFTAFYDKWEDALTNVMGGNNYLQLLAKREGIENELYDAYMSIDMSSYESYILDEGNDAFLEMMLAEDVMYNKLTVKQRENMKNTATERKEFREKWMIRLWWASPECDSMFFMIREKSNI